MPNVIHESAVLGKQVEIGHFTVIMKNVTIGDGTRVGHGVIIHPDTVIGSRVRIEDHAVLGKPPARSASMANMSGEEVTPTDIDDDVIVGVGAVLYRGSSIARSAFIADYAAVREESVVGEETVIGRGTAIENRVRIGKRCKIESGVFVAALSTIGDGCFIAPEVVITNDRFLGRRTDRANHYAGATIQNGGRVGANATLLPGLTIEADGVSGAGSLLTHDIPPRQVVVGSPARFLRDVPEEELLENQ